MPGTFTDKPKSEHVPLVERYVTMVNISLQEWVLYRTYRPYVIRARDPETGYSTVKVTGHVAGMDIGDQRQMNLIITPEEIAADLEREINTLIPSPLGSIPFSGVFVADGGKPTARELDLAEKRLSAFYMKLVGMADAEWDRSHNPILIGEDWKRAARHLNLTKEWLYEQKQMMECPVCAEKIRTGVAMCKSCGAILDRKKAAEYGVGVVDEGPKEPPKRKTAGN